MKKLYGSNLSAINEKGFTLIEIMIAMGVFAIGILAVAAMQITASQSNRSATLRTMAVTQATQQMEELVTQDYDAIGDGTASYGPVDVTWTVTTDSPITGTKTIDMTATWEDRGGQRSTTFSFITADL